MPPFLVTFELFFFFAQEDTPTPQTGTVVRFTMKDYRPSVLLSFDAPKHWVDALLKQVWGVSS